MVSELAKLLKIVIEAAANYKRTRDEMLAAGQVSHGETAVISDRDLIALFKGDAKSLSVNAQDLIDKYSLDK